MPLLADVPPSGRAATWTFIHIWRVADGMIVEHWACRDDMGLVDQLRDPRPASGDRTSASANRCAASASPNGKNNEGSISSTSSTQ